MLGDFLKRTFATPQVGSREELGKVLVADASRYAERPELMDKLLRNVANIDPKKLAQSEQQHRSTIETIEQARGRPGAYWSMYTKHFRACVMNPRSETQSVIAARQAIKALLLRTDESYKMLYANQSPRHEVTAARGLASEIRLSIDSLESGMRTTSNFRGSDSDEMESESAKLKSMALGVPAKIRAKYSELSNALAGIPADQKRGVRLSSDILPSNFDYLGGHSGGNNEADVEALVAGVGRAVRELRNSERLLSERVLSPLGIASSSAGSELRELEARALNRMFKSLGFDDQKILAAMGFLGYNWGEILQKDEDQAEKLRSEAAAAAKAKADADAAKALEAQRLKDLKDRDEAEQKRRTAEAERVAREAQQERDRQEQARQEQARQDQARQAEERQWRQNMAEGLAAVVDLLSAIRDAARRQSEQQASRAGSRFDDIQDAEFTIRPNAGGPTGGGVGGPTSGVPQIGGGAPGPFDPPVRGYRADGFSLPRPAMQLHYTPYFEKTAAEAALNELRQRSVSLANAAVADGATKETVRPFAAMLDKAVSGLVNVLSRNPENRGMLEPLIRLGTSVTQIDNIAFGVDFAVNLGKKLTDWLGSLVTRANPVLPPGVKKLSITTDPRPDEPTDQPQL